MDISLKRGFVLARSPGAYMERSQKRGNYRPRRRRRPPVLYAILTLVMLAVLYPVGLIMLWRRKLRWPAALKAALSLVFAAVFALGWTAVYRLDAVRPYADELIGDVRQALDIGGPTAEPSAPPEGEPSAPPEDEPTAPPEDEPTAPPEDEPTAPPEDEPTAPPEDEPTAPPEGEPTAPPEGEPTAPPEDEPTPAPTFNASAVVAWPGGANLSVQSDIQADAHAVLRQREQPLLAEPTAEPTEAPTEEPTAEPTEAPTEEPTAVPTEAPTEEPTAEPTEAPTEEPTAEPTEAPTEEPTAVPTEAPTPNVQPTIRPTATARPTAAPTAVPTQAPTVQPTATPLPVPEVVYHTLTGSRFHLMPDCGLTEGADPDTWEHSVEAGYKPCPDCVGVEYPHLMGITDPSMLLPATPTPAATAEPLPTATNMPGVYDLPEVVYHTETGSRFHLMPDCGLTEGADPDTWEHSVEAGYNPCPDCVGKQYPEAVEALKNGELVISAANAAQYFVPLTPAPEASPTPEFVPLTPAPSDAPSPDASEAAPSETPAAAASQPGAQSTPGSGQLAQFVYYDSAANTYHTRDDCALGGGAAMALDDALALGAQACPECAADGAGRTGGAELAVFVYHEEDGQYYHAGADCPSAEGAVPETGDEAYLNGEQPCPDCEPLPLDKIVSDPELKSQLEEQASRTVYTGGGQYYHEASVCGGMTDGRPITRADAIAQGLTECPYCHPDATPTPAPNYSEFDQQTVYYGGGQYYHEASVCGGMTDGRPMMRGEAKAVGALECPYCHPDATPTPRPTPSPTPEPTEEPTLEPTAEPTPEPTAEPTPEPTAEPTLEPTAEPTLEPTEEPTLEPTEEPTPEPGAPTAIPTIEPVETQPVASQAPTAAPAASSAPAAPTAEPHYDAELGLQFEQQYVYSAEDGQYYHRSADCDCEEGELRRVSRAVALVRGQSACPECAPDDDLNLPYAIVYHTEGDAYYHLSETCPELGEDSSLMLFGDAVLEGWLPCPRCVTEMPEALPTLTPDGDSAGVVRWVYRTLNGAHYHSRATCSGMYNPYLVTLEDAEDAGLTPCPHCEAEDAPSGES